MLIAGAATIAGCEKDMTDNTPLAYNTERKAYVQWFNAMNSSTRNYIYVNGVPANGTAVAFGSAFPSGSTAFALYSGTNGITIKDTLSSTTQVPQNFVYNFQDGRSYTLFTYGTTTAPKRLIVENNVTYPETNVAKVRFINLIYNATPPPNVDIFSVNQNTNLFTNIPVEQLSDFITIQPNLSDTWQVRQTGTTTVLATLAVTTTTFTPRRSYTLVYRGTHATASTRALAVIATQ